VTGAVDVSIVGISTAFAAGLISFVSPCVWPLVPAYLSYVSGVSFDRLEESWRRVTAATFAFVLGFTVVFTILGASLGALHDVIASYRTALELAGGTLIVIMGLALLGVASGFFGRELRLSFGSRPVSLLGAFVTGVVFSIGWSPCIGTTLGAILTLAGTQGSAASGAVLLAAYSLGLGVPFLLSGLFLSTALSVSGALRRYTPVVMRASGVVLIFMGVLVATGELDRMSIWLQRY
jgi:cytochrome c-type biogenesis protein